ncbi:fungal-specific transcription factor domain-containing protein [Trichoderma chlorosporum]
MTTKTCIRCHGKKIRCTGYPSCRACLKASANCEPYTRHRIGDSLAELKYYRQRTMWLEDELHRNFHIRCKDVPTGTPLRPIGEDLVHGAEQSLLTEPSPSPVPLNSSYKLQDSSSPTDHTADIGMLTLNATGETRYLGPSSGVFFATYTGAVVRSCVFPQNLATAVFTSQRTHFGPQMGIGSVNGPFKLSSNDVHLFMQSYKMWILPLYPILNSEDLDMLTSEYNKRPNFGKSDACRRPEEATRMMLFYSVMALGAINAANTRKQLHEQHEQEKIAETSTLRPSPASLCAKAVQLMNHNTQIIHSSIPFIQVIALISIYSSYESVGSSQWQLAGLAMRMAIEKGLHCTYRVSKQSNSAKDEMNRLFWTIYAVEISLAYNLGRPPSISEEHIATDLPILSNENLLSLHHIRHRQIQSRIVAQIYSLNNRSRNMSTQQMQSLISSLQEELDQWRSDIPISPYSKEQHPYPHSYWDRLYHGTTFVLHRSSPLCPSPPVQSQERCIRSAGIYLDNVLNILRVSNVPLSWMLVQGVLFAGLTMLVTARTGLLRLLPGAGAPFLLVDLHSWTRNCSICLAIMNERLKEDLLSKLESQFDSLANDTLRMISDTITSQTTNNSPHSAEFPTNIDIAGFAMGSNQIPLNDASNISMNLAEDWSYLDIFKDFMGQDPAHTFWNMVFNEHSADELPNQPAAEAEFP